jgi:hypothetical protein
MLFRVREVVYARALIVIPRCKLIVWAVNMSFTRVKLSSIALFREPFRLAILARQHFHLVLVVFIVSILFPLMSLALQKLFQICSIRWIHDTYWWYLW